MSYLKEPQRAVSGVQRIIDGAHLRAPSSLIFPKLSRGLTRIGFCISCGYAEPLDGSSLTPVILFRRRVLHKVQGRLLPSRTINQGVDMGRSFSVYLFCFAMDPLFHYLNRIPGVISVQAYVDDITNAGTAADPRWIYDVADVYQRIASASFHIDSHACFRAVVNDDMRFQPRLVTTEELLRYWPTIADLRIRHFARSSIVQYAAR